MFAVFVRCMRKRTEIQQSINNTLCYDAINQDYTCYNFNLVWYSISSYDIS